MPSSQPQIRVTVGGIVVAGAMAARIEQVGYFAADRFEVMFAIGADPAIDAQYFASIGAPAISIDLAVLPYSFVNMLIGQVDHVRLDLKQKTATLTGRDLSSLLIDTEIAETFANQTSSQIARAIAARHGLTANVTPTSTPVGQYYDLDHARSALTLNSRAGTEWNLLSWLAGIEGFTLAVKGQTLQFGLPATGQAYLLNVQDCIELVLDGMFAIPATAKVKSWNTRQKMAISGMAGTNGGLGTTLIRPNLTNQQAGQFAAGHLADLARHKMTMLATMPGELTIMPNSSLFLNQTETSFDQTFIVDHVERSIDARRGFTQIVRAYAAS